MELEEYQKYQKAIKGEYDSIPKEKSQMMYSDVYGYDEGYFVEFDDLIEYCEREGIEIPKHVWSTTKTSLTINAEFIVENACEELWEGAYDNIDNIEELQELLDNWCGEQTGADTYCVDYQYAISVPRTNI